MRTYTLTENGTPTTSGDKHVIYEWVDRNLPFLLPESALVYAGSIVMDVNQGEHYEIAASDEDASYGTQPIIEIQEHGQYHKVTLRYPGYTRQISLTMLTGNVERTLVQLIHCFNSINLDAPVDGQLEVPHVVIDVDTKGCISGVYTNGMPVKVFPVCSRARGCYSDPIDSRPLAEMSEHAKYQYEEVK